MTDECNTCLYPKIGGCFYLNNGGKNFRDSIMEPGGRCKLHMNPKASYSKVYDKWCEKCSHRNVCAFCLKGGKNTFARNDGSCKEFSQ